MHTDTETQTQTHSNTQTCARAHTHTHTHTHTRTRTCTRTCAHTHTKHNFKNGKMQPSATMSSVKVQLNSTQLRLTDFKVSAYYKIQILAKKLLVSTKIHSFINKYLYT